MTGLDPTKDTIMSIACYITDSDLSPMEHVGFHAFLHHTHAQLDTMGEWCTKQHGHSGLSQKCLDSGTTAEEAASDLLAYIKEYIPDQRRALLAGNSVHADRAFLVRQPYAPIMAYLHHRILDVSSLKEAARRWAPEGVLAKIPKKAGKHEAKADILESIQEAKFYREAFFLPDTTG